jgi:hypothetical protein
MYEFYKMNQEWTKAWARQFEPMLNNPLMDWYMDLWIQAGLHAWFWPGAMVTMEDQLKELAQTFNICKV